jgi:hypothetical protein
LKFKNPRKDSGRQPMRKAFNSGVKGLIETMDEDSVDGDGGGGGGGGYGSGGDDTKVCTYQIQ